MRFLFRVIAIMLVVAGCRAFGSARDQDTLASRMRELVATHERFSTVLSGGDFIGGMSEIIGAQGFYPAALLAVGERGRGPAGARAFLERDTLNRNSRGILTIVRVDVSADGNDGYSYGYLDVVRANGDTVFGAYKSYWRRNAAGKWEALLMSRGPRTRGPATASARLSPGPYKVWPARDSVSAWNSLRATEAAFSDSSRSSMAAAFKSFAAPDAGKISGATYVFGPAEIEKDFLAPPPPNFTGIKWSAEFGTVAASGDLGFNAGRVYPRPDAAGNTPPGGGMFVTVWRRQPNGEWKYVVD